MGPQVGHILSLRFPSEYSIADWWPYCNNKCRGSPGRSWGKYSTRLTGYPWTRTMRRSGKEDPL